MGAQDKNWWFESQLIYTDGFITSSLESGLLEAKGYPVQTGNEEIQLRQIIKLHHILCI